MGFNSDLIFGGEPHKLSSFFGDSRGSRTHAGVDYSTNLLPLKQYSIFDGIVKKVVKTETIGNERGKLVEIEYPGLGKTMIYQHLSDVLVNQGDRVGAGSVVGLTGDTGLNSKGKKVSTGVHAHIEVIDSKTGKAENYESLNLQGILNTNRQGGLKSNQSTNPGITPLTGEEEGIFNMGFMDKIEEWLTSSAFVFVGLAVLLFGIYFLFGSAKTTIIKEVVKNVK